MSCTNFFNCAHKFNNSITFTKKKEKFKVAEYNLQTLNYSNGIVVKHTVTKVVVKEFHFKRVYNNFVA